MVNIHIHTKKISPIILLLGLGLIVLPETIITIPLLPFGRADAALVPVESASPIECAACEYLANGMNQTIIHNPKVIAFVTTDIEKVCAVLPESVQAMCIDAAQTVAPQLLNHLGDFIATDGCQDLGICHSLA